MGIFLNAGIAALHQASRVSKDWSSVAQQAIQALYGIQHGGETYLDYTMLLREHDAIVQRTGRDGSMAEASRALNSSLDCKCIQSILKAEFGHCIGFATGHLPRFCLQPSFLGTLVAKQRISVLPYILDQSANDPLWICLVRGLAELGRVDLLRRMTFSRITPDYFYELMSVALPEPVIAAAAESLMRNWPDSRLARLLAFAGSGSGATSLATISRAPLFVLQFLHQKSLPVPDGCVFVGGLDESSIAFWMYVQRQKVGEAKKLLALVEKHGNAECRHLPSAFHGPASDAGLTASEKDVYRAMLIRFYSGPICNDHVVQNCESVLEKLLKAGYHTNCALLDCRQSHILYKCRVGGFSSSDFQMIIDKMHRLNDQGLALLLQKYVQHSYMAPHLLKRLIKEKTDDSYIQIVWSAIQHTQCLRLLDFHCCCAPLETLKRLAFEQDASFDCVEKMLDILAGYQGYGDRISREAHIFYTVLFWEAPEKVVAHFLGRVPLECKLVYKPDWGLLQVAKYSARLWRMLIRRFGFRNDLTPVEIEKVRPDLSRELALLSLSPLERCAPNASESIVRA